MCTAYIESARFISINAGGDCHFNLANLENVHATDHYSHIVPSHSLYVSPAVCVAQGPQDVPIPGGTVYIRQRPCQYAAGVHVSAACHQHVRRFMIPRDSLAVARRAVLSRGLRRLKSAHGGQPDARTYDTDVTRPKTAPVSQCNAVAAAGWM